MEKNKGVLIGEFVFGPFTSEEAERWAGTFDHIGEFVSTFSWQIVDIFQMSPENALRMLIDLKKLR